MKKLWIVLALMLPVWALADETELYMGPAVSVPSRIMLLVDTSDSMEGTAGDPASSNATPYYRGTCYEAAADTEAGIKNEGRKICKLKKILKEFLDADASAANEELRWSDDTEVGLARYAEPGALILAPVRKLSDRYSLGGDEKTHRQHIVDALNEMTLAVHHTRNNTIVKFGGWTPLIGSYLEVAHYLTGGAAISKHSQNYSEGDVWNDVSKTVYKSPVQPGMCNANNTHIVVLTDGKSTNENMAAKFYPPEVTDGSLGDVYVGDKSIGIYINRLFKHDNTLTGYVTSGGNGVCPATVNTLGGPSDAVWPCANLIAKGLFTFSKVVDDVVTSLPIKTHTIAYDIDGIADDMEAWATAGGGSSHNASNEEQLRAALKAIQSEVESLETFSAVSPGVGINQVNRFAHLDEMYFSLFRPSNRAFWYGNLKKYYLGSESNIVSSRGGSTKVIDDDGDFKDNVTSDWSIVDSPFTHDGEHVFLGGSASKIKAAGERTLWTQLSSDPETLAEVSTTSSEELTNFLFTDFLNAMGGEGAVSADAQSAYQAKINDMLGWLMGVDADSSEWLNLVKQSQNLTSLPVDQRTASRQNRRTFYGAAIHSSPVLVNYVSRSNSGVPLVDIADQSSLVFASTNDGKLYGVDAATGVEKVAYMPQTMIQRDGGAPSRLERMYDAARNQAEGSLIYGLDGTWVPWRYDTDGNGNIDTSGSNDFVYLFGGMRRGGRNYYLLDATRAYSGNLDQLAVLKGGTPDSEFLNMGQTWSTPTLGIMRYLNTPVAVMVVGGGYDVTYDNGTRADSTPLGAQIYFVLAHDVDVNGTTLRAGRVLWWASSDAIGTGAHQQIAALRHSVPSAVKTLDLDGDGFVDHVYVGDMGGQLFRFDIDNAADATSLVSNTSDVLVAQLGLQVGNGLAGASGSVNDRRFFYPPSVAIMRDSQSRKYVAVAIGSGWASKPKSSTVDDRFFYIKDYEPFGFDEDVLQMGSMLPQQGEEPAASAIVSLALVDNDGVAVEGSLAAPSQDEINNARALTLDLLQSAEKLLGSPLIVNGQVIFSTYYNETNTNNAADQCLPDYGNASVYRYFPGQATATQKATHLNLSVATTPTTLLSTLPGQDTDGDGVIDTPPSLNMDVFSGTAAIDRLDLGAKKIRKTRWYQVPD